MGPMPGSSPQRPRGDEDRRGRGQVAAHRYGNRDARHEVGERESRARHRLWPGNDEHNAGDEHGGGDTEHEPPRGRPIVDQHAGTEYPERETHGRRRTGDRGRELGRRFRRRVDHVRGDRTRGEAGGQPLQHTAKKKRTDAVDGSENAAPGDRKYERRDSGRSPPHLIGETPEDEEREHGSDEVADSDDREICIGDAVTAAEGVIQRNGCGAGRENCCSS